MNNSLKDDQVRFVGSGLKGDQVVCQEPKNIQVVSLGP